MIGVGSQESQVGVPKAWKSLFESRYFHATSHVKGSFGAINLGRSNWFQINLADTIRRFWNFLLLCLFFLNFVCTCVNGHATVLHVWGSEVTSRSQFSFYHELQILNPDHQVWWQTVLPVEPFCQPLEQTCLSQAFSVMSLRTWQRRSR